MNSNQPFDCALHRGIETYLKNKYNHNSVYYYHNTNTIRNIGLTNSQRHYFNRKYVVYSTTTNRWIYIST